MTPAGEREEGRQNVLEHEGAPADPNYDTNEKADDRAEVVQPDSETPAPRPNDD
jgi:hypothetical protein